MFAPEPPKSEEVEHLLRNAQLRDELEPLFDEYLSVFDVELEDVA